MPFNFAVRITKPFSDLSGTVRQWAMKADKLLCYEHDNTDKLHCHLLMLNVSVDAERLKQISKESGVTGKGNEFWSFKTKSKKTGSVSAETAERYITYMSKGRYDPKYVKGYEPDYVQHCKESWEQGDSAPSKEELLYLEFEEAVIMFCREGPELLVKELISCEQIRRMYWRYSLGGLRLLNVLGFGMSGQRIWRRASF